MQKETNQHTKPYLGRKERTSNHQAGTEQEFKEERVEIVIENVDLPPNETYSRTKQRTELALKNPSSFFIATHFITCILVENDATIFSDDCQLMCYGEGLSDLAYIRDLDCYLMLTDHHLYRKNIDDQPPYPVMTFKNLIRKESCLKYSELNKKLILSNSGGDLLFINLERAKVEFKVKRGTWYVKILSFKLFGENQNKMASLTSETEILVHTVNFQRKKISLVQKVNYREFGRQDVGFVAVCNQDKLLFVGVPNLLVVFKLEANQLIKLTQGALIKRISPNNRLTDMECLRYVGKHVLWVGIEDGSYGHVHIFYYDLEKKELKFLKRKSCRVFQAEKIQKLGKDLYYTGWNSKVMKLRITF